MFSDDDWSPLAQRVNEFDAELCLALVVDDGAVQRSSYFETAGSAPTADGASASSSSAEFPRTPVWAIGTLTGMRLPILRETRPPTVRVKLGPPEQVAEHRALLASALGRAVQRWASDPV